MDAIMFSPFSSPALAGPASASLSRTTTTTTTTSAPPSPGRRPGRLELEAVLHHAQVRAHTRRLRAATFPHSSAPAGVPRRTARAPAYTFLEPHMTTAPSPFVGADADAGVLAASVVLHVSSPNPNPAPAPAPAPEAAAARPVFPHRRSRVAPIHPLRRRMHWRAQGFCEDATDVVLSPMHVPPERRTPGAPARGPKPQSQFQPQSHFASLPLSLSRPQPQQQQSASGSQPLMTPRVGSYFHLPSDLLATPAPAWTETKAARPIQGVGLGIFGVGLAAPEAAGLGFLGVDFDAGASSVVESY